MSEKRRKNRTIFIDVRRSLNTFDEGWRLRQLAGNFCHFKKKGQGEFVEEYGEHIKKLNQAFPSLLFYQHEGGVMAKIPM